MIPSSREDRGPHGVFGGKEGEDAGEDVVRQAAEGSIEA